MARKRKKPAPKPRRKRATTVDRAERALERASQNLPAHTDDPARDHAEKEGGVIKPLPHAD